MATLAPVRPITVHRTRTVVDTVRWAPAPRWEGGAASKSRYVAYLAGSLAAWVAVGLGLSAAIGAALGH